MTEAEASAVSTSPAEETAALARRLRAGEAEAQAELYDRFAPGLHRFAVTRLRGDVQTAEEVVVETLVEAVRDIARFSPRRASFSAWLYGLARRRISLELRRQARRKSVPPRAQVPLEAALQEAVGADVAEVVAARVEAHRQVEAIAEVLSDLEMEALVLSTIRELSVREIGQLLHRSEQAVHSLLHRARQKARERLKQDE